MNFDINLLLIPLLSISGVILLTHFLLNGRKSGSHSAQAADIKGGLEGDINVPWWLDYSRSLFPVILFVVIIRSFIIEPYQIPSSSMEPTLERGDFILVSKFRYGLRLPISNYEFVSFRRPSYGDVIVFNFPQEPRVRYIKRVIGTAGDVIRYDNKTLYINGKQVDQQLLGDQGEYSPEYRDLEALLEEKRHLVRHYKFIDNQELHAEEWAVPQGHYFVMGDNRDNSNDSRYWGFVPHNQLVGEAFMIWLNWKSWSSMPSLKRNGRII